VTIPDAKVRLLIRGLRVAGCGFESDDRAERRSTYRSGGGIWNGPLICGPAGATLQGGGIYTIPAITSTNSQVIHHHPNDCTGC
jgi:hypothetical protein